MTSLISLLEEYNLRFGRQDIHDWSPNPLKGLSCKSFRLLLDPSLANESVFDVLWRIKIPKKVKFFT